MAFVYCLRKDSDNRDPATCKIHVLLSEHTCFYPFFYCKGPVRTIVRQIVVATRVANECVWQQSGVTRGRCLRREQKSFAYRKPSRLHGDSMGSSGSIASIFCLRSHTMVRTSPPCNALTMSRAARRWSCVGNHVCTWLQASP